MKRSIKISFALLAVVLLVNPLDRFARTEAKPERLLTDRASVRNLSAEPNKRTSETLMRLRSGLFCAQSVNRIHSSCPPRRDVASGSCGEDQHQRGSDICGKIQRTHFIQQ